MKTEFADINETRKNVRVEIPTDIVNAEIDRVATDYSRKARIPGFRPGKAPARVIKQRFKDQILHDVAHDLIPRAVDDALREKGMEPVDTPDVRDVTIEEGQPLTFTASFDTVPPFDPGDLSAIALQRPAVAIDDAAVDGALQRLRDRAARHEPVEGRGVDDGDTVVLDLERRDGKGAPDTHTDVSIELGAKANPPGFDAHLLVLEVGATKSFDIHYPQDYPIGELANTDVSYTVTIKGIKRRVVPELDDEFAKDLGEFDTLDALKARGREDFARRLIDQHIDPRQAGIDWNAFRESQRDVAREAVAAALALDEVTRREQLQVTEEEVEQEVGRYAERTGRTPAAVRAALEKEGGLVRVAAGLRREKSIDFVMSRAKSRGIRNAFP